MDSDCSVDAFEQDSVCCKDCRPCRNRSNSVRSFADMAPCGKMASVATSSVTRNNCSCRNRRGPFDDDAAVAAARGTPALWPRAPPSSVVDESSSDDLFSSLSHRWRPVCPDPVVAHHRDTLPSSVDLVSFCPV